MLIFSSSVFPAISYGMPNWQACRGDPHECYVLDVRWLGSPQKMWILLLRRESATYYFRVRKCLRLACCLISKLGAYAWLESYRRVDDVELNVC